MFISPYDTTACRNHRIDDLIDSLREMKIEGELVQHDDRVFLLDDREKDLKPFAHPLVMAQSRRSDETFVVADTRSSAKTDRESGQLKGGSDFEFLKLRAMLMGRGWLDGYTRDLKNIGDFPIMIFARVMAENLGRRMNVDLDIQLNIQIISAYYYLCLFEPYGEIDTDDDDVRVGYAKQISRATKTNVPKVLELIDEMPAMYTIEEYTEQLVEYGGSVRLSKLKPALLFTMLGGVWFGANASEVVATSLEHPPTFVAMLYMVASERGYRKTVLGQLIKRIDRRGDMSEHFIKRVNHLTSFDGD